MLLAPGVLTSVNVGMVLSADVSALIERLRHELAALRQEVAEGRGARRARGGDGRCGRIRRRAGAGGSRGLRARTLLRAGPESVGQRVGPAAGQAMGQRAGQPAGPAAGQLAGLARMRWAGAAGAGAIFGLNGRRKRAPVLLRFRTHLPVIEPPRQPWGARGAIQAARVPDRRAAIVPQPPSRATPRARRGRAWTGTSPSPRGNRRSCSTSGSGPCPGPPAGAGAGGATPPWWRPR